jgi:ectoine hydroxylase
MYNAEFNRSGVVLVPGLIPEELLDRVQAELPVLLAERGPHVFLESDGKTVRAVYGLHQRDDVWRELAELPALHEIVADLLQEPYYLFQWKINPKAPLVGDRWEWHRDYTYWGAEDGMPEPRALTAAVLLSDTPLAAGPTVVVKGSHLLPLSDAERRQLGRTGSGERTGDDDWSRLVDNGLPYVVDDTDFNRISGEYGVVRSVGEAGTVMFFHSNVIHGSLPNTSAYVRDTAFLTFNPVSNAPKQPSPRPDHFVNQYPDRMRWSALAQS